MQVKLINKEEVKDFFIDYGEVAKVCYDTKTNHPENIGKACFNSGHFSGSRGTYFTFLVEDCPRFTIDQAVRHEVGVFKNVQSFRYVDKDGFSYDIPDSIKDNLDLLNRYVQHMRETEQLYKDIQEESLKKCKSQERANEQARYVLPISTKSSFVIGFTVEGLIHFMNMRLCNRAEDRIRELAKLMKVEVLEVLPELKDSLVPKCEKDLFCTEHNPCGKAPSKEEVKIMLDKYNV